MMVLEVSPNCSSTWNQKFNYLIYSTVSQCLGLIHLVHTGEAFFMGMYVSTVALRHSALLMPTHDNAKALPLSVTDGGMFLMYLLT